MIYRGFTQSYEISVAHAYGYEPNRAIGLPEPAPYVPRWGSDDWYAAQRKNQPRPERQRPSINVMRDPDSRRSRAKAVAQQEAA